MEEEAIQYSFGAASTSLETEEPRRKRYKKDAYFSDEEELDDSWFAVGAVWKCADGELGKIGFSLCIRGYAKVNERHSELAKCQIPDQLSWCNKRERERILAFLWIIDLRGKYDFFSLHHKLDFNAG